jgi:hypothetical protein
LEGREGIILCPRGTGRNEKEKKRKEAKKQRSKEAKRQRKEYESAGFILAQQVQRDRRLAIYA